MKDQETKTITQTQYYQLAGLQVLAQRAYREIEALNQAAVSITEEKDREGQPADMGHTYDMMSQSRGLDEALKLMNIKVEGKCT